MAHVGAQDSGQSILHALQAAVTHGALDRAAMLRADADAVLRAPSLKQDSLPAPDTQAAKLADRLVSLSAAAVQTDAKRWRRACLR